MPNQKVSRELAQKHWGWLSFLIGYINPMGQPLEELIEYIYVTSFIHGYKHGAEDIKGR